MKKTDEAATKAMVREKYSAIAEQSRDENASSCCGAGGCGTVDYTVFAEDYSKMKGYAKDADLGLGCGIPTEFADIKEGMTVVDLGSGAGNDCFVARTIVGASGKVIGVDMTKTMINKARENSKKLSYNNVVFRLGEIENIPITSGSADVVISNCVFNLVPDKRRAFEETFRILKNGGHFTISDVAVKGDLPEGLRSSAEMYAGCVAGAVGISDTIRFIHDAGFTGTEIVKQKQVAIPDDILKQFLDSRQLADYHNKVFGLYSITVRSTRPACDPNSCCC